RRHRLRAADEPEESPVRVIGRRDVVDDHGRRVMIDELDQVELALLHVGDVPDDRLEALGLEHRAEQLDGVGARVEYGDRRLAAADDFPGRVARSRARLTHGMSIPIVESAAERIVPGRRCRAGGPSAPGLYPARPIRLAMMAISSAGSTGFVTWMLKPARKLRTRSSGRPKAVSATAGTLPPCSGLSARSLRISEYPSWPGISMSETSASGRRRAIASSASSVVRHSITSAPTWISTSVISSTVVGSSSITTMRAPASDGPSSIPPSRAAIGRSSISATISGSFTTNVAPFPSPGLSA